MRKKLNIIHIASEVSPFVKTGGLANVTRSLPKSQNKLGHDVGIFIPFYESKIDQQKYKFEKVISDLLIGTYQGQKLKVNVLKSYLADQLPIYFIQNTKFFSQKNKLYGSKRENVRFYLFNLACLKVMRKMNLLPDIIHCHDWHAGLIPYLLRTRYKKSELNQRASLVFTIHNLIFQLGHNWWEIDEAQRDLGRKALPKFDDPIIENINFAKRAILNTDVINTVSESHAQEILTKEHGQGLNRILVDKKERLFGIINGIDYYAYNPLTDLGLRQNFSFENIDLKIDNKLYLQKKIKLKQNKNIPIVCMTSRVTEQKGFELMMQEIDNLLKLKLQLVVMGDGDSRYIRKFKSLNKKYPDRFKYLPFDRNLETLIYAASDFILLPSRYEPCGINILIAMRYGCVPIVHSIGGLADTVTNYNPIKKTGSGFVLKSYSGRALYVTVVKALEHFKYQRDWKFFVQRVMQISTSWEIPAGKYIKLYQKAIKFHKDLSNNNK